jgi:hypothetical protein
VHRSKVKRLGDPAGYRRTDYLRSDQRGHAQFCPQCRTLVSASDRYCPSCGVPIVGAHSRSAERRRRRRTAVAVVTALLLIGGGTLAGSLLSGGHDSGAGTEKSTTATSQAGDAWLAWNSLVDAGRARRSQLQAAVNLPPDIETGWSATAQINRDFALVVAQIDFPREARTQADKLIRAANDLAAVEVAYNLSVRDSVRNHQPLPSGQPIVGAFVRVDSAERVLIATLLVLAGPVGANA